MVTPADYLSEFRTELDEYSEDSYSKAKAWRIVWYTSRSLLIVFGILTSADTLTLIDFLHPAAPYFGLAVAAITAFEVFLQPETKYKAHYIANDDYLEIRKRVELVALETPADISIRKEVLQAFGDANKRLRSAL